MCVEADLVVDDHTHAVVPDLPDDLVPVRRVDEALVRDPVLLRRCRIMHAQLPHRAFPVEDQLAAMPVHPKIGRVRPAHDAEREWRTAGEGRDTGRHYPVHRGTRDVDAVNGPRDDAALVRDEMVDQVLSHPQPFTT